MIICDKPTAIVLLLTLTSPDFEPAKIEMCFEEREHCTSFEEVIVNRFREVTNGKVGVGSSSCRRRR